MNIVQHFFSHLFTKYCNMIFSCDILKWSNDLFKRLCFKDRHGNHVLHFSLGPHNHIQIIFSTCFFRTGFSWYKDWHENHLTFLSLRACNIFISQIHWQTFLLKKKGDPGSILYYILCNCAVFQMVWVVSTLCWANTSSNSID